MKPVSNFIEIHQLHKVYYVSLTEGYDNCLFLRQWVFKLLVSINLNLSLIKLKVVYRQLSLSELVFPDMLRKQQYLHENC